MNKIYHLQSIETQIVKAIFEGTEIDKIKSEFESVIVENLLGIFEEKELGEYYKNFIPHEPFRVGSLNSNSIEKITLDNIFYELPCKCENNCSHCFLPKTGGCTTCKKVEINKDFDINWESYYTVLRDTVSMGFKNIYFQGGNPLSEWGNLKKIIDFTNLIKNNEQIIYVIAPHIEENKSYIKKLEYLINNQIRPIISIEYSSQFKTEFNQSIKVLNYLGNPTNSEKNGIILNVVLESKLAGDNPLENAITNHLDYTFSYIIDDKTDSLDHNKYYYNQAVSYHSYMNSEFFHPCLKGTIAIDAEQRVLPCPRINEVLLDKYAYHSFMELFQEYYKLSPYWSLSLNKVNPCNKCEFNRLCYDCRAVELAHGCEIDHKKTCSSHANLYQPIS
ncbi:hypothetical protein [Paenibacillus sp. FSL K6-0108]|uniref:hypothetical protein n=1 Tax=Paenibacillus sp. FSL K6-0108 TaxID=2921417 RepID=UPI003254F259